MSPRTTLLALLAAIAPASAQCAPEKFTLDVDHTFPSLEFPHMGLSVWRGKFNKTTGTFVYDRTAKTGTVEAVIDVASIDFGHDKMNEHAISKDWLNAAQFPTMTYKGTLKFNGETATEVDGQLTLKGVTRPVKLKLNSFKCMMHPFYKKEACGADAECTLNRADFGMSQYTENGMGQIHLRIQVEALKDG
jgi:polyisoprenoid-binding protein YceI